MGKGTIKKYDCSGKIYSDLTVLEYVGGGMWKCQCSCSTVKNFYGYALEKGKSRNCGCKFNKTHGESKTPLYNVWAEMKQRCYNPKDTYYQYYGGRGITVCQAWLNDYVEFRNWSYANGYKDERLSSGRNKYTIDRINVNGNYEPSNCRWVEWETQNNNMRNNHFLTYNGETLTLAQWAKKVGLKSRCIKGRLSRGWSVERALTEPLQQ